MSLNKYIDLTTRIVRYNLKIIFAGKFFWFLLASFFCLFHVPAGME